MAELVDALVLGTSTLGCESSSLSPSTIRQHTMPKKNDRSKSDPRLAPRVAHVDFLVDKERHFIRYVKYLSNPWGIIWRNFLVGTFQGLGFIIGSALFLAGAGFVTTKVLGEIPLFSDLAEVLNFWLETINSAK